MKFLFWSGDFRKIAGEFLSEFCWQKFPAIFSASSRQGVRPPKNTPKLSAFFSNLTLLNPKVFHADCLLTCETKLFKPHALKSLEVRWGFFWGGGELGGGWGHTSENIVQQRSCNSCLATKGGVYRLVH